MPAVARNRSVPHIVVSDADCDRLTDLATASLERLPEVAEELLAEMERAKVVSEDKVPADVVRMGSTVTFRSDAGTDGEQHELTETLVYPVDEDSDARKLSVMTPVGAALIGLAVGQSIAWTARDGRRHRLTVLEVS
ncbi:MAG: nucleoside diphosphate kinase regulator [Rhodospirillales bacterium]|jgi:regulator of nucleoside diphosphate kinase|nr:nucleoside diphosphate kinase regulator [Rhodospirillales bacterium]